MPLGIKGFECDPDRLVLAKGDGRCLEKQPLYWDVAIRGH
jgi:hypothetical protein